MSTTKKPDNVNPDQVINVGSVQAQDEYKYLDHYNNWIKTKPEDINDLEAFKRYLEKNINYKSQLENAFSFLDLNFEQIKAAYQLRRRISRKLFDE